MKNFIYQWEQPREVSIWESNFLLQDWHIKFLRTIAVVIIIEYLFYIFLKQIPFEEIGIKLWKLFLNAFIFAIIISLYVYIIGPLIMRFTKTRYAILEKGIHVAAGSYTR